MRLLSELVEGLGGQVMGIGALWRRTRKTEIDGKPIFSLVSRDFPTYPPDACPLCKKGVALNEEFVKRREHRKGSSAHETELTPDPQILSPRGLRNPAEGIFSLTRLRAAS